MKIIQKISVGVFIALMVGSLPELGAAALADALAQSVEIIQSLRGTEYP